MLASIISVALRYRLLSLLCAVVFLGIGLRAANRTPLDVFPEFAQPAIEVQTEAPGLSTEEVESLVTLPRDGALGSARAYHAALGLSWDCHRSCCCFAKERISCAQTASQRTTCDRSPRLPCWPVPRDLACTVFDQPRAEDRNYVEEAVPDGAIGTGPVHHPSPRLLAVKESPTSQSGACATDSFRYWLIRRESVGTASLSRSGSARCCGRLTAFAGAFWTAPISGWQCVMSPLTDQQRLAQSAIPFGSGGSADRMRLGDVTSVTVGYPPPIGAAVINGRGDCY